LERGPDREPASPAVGRVQAFHPGEPDAPRRRGPRRSPHGAPQYGKGLYGRTGGDAAYNCTGGDAAYNCTGGDAAYNCTGGDAAPPAVAAVARTAHHSLVLVSTCPSSSPALKRSPDA
jgi:hypothetical protein